MITAIKGWLEQVHNLRQRLDPQTAGRRGRVTILRSKTKSRHVSAVRCPARRTEVTWTIEHPSEPIQVFMARAALGQVLANLVDNAIFWLIRSKGRGGRNDRNREPSAAITGSP